MMGSVTNVRTLSTSFCDIFYAEHASQPLGVNLQPGSWGDCTRGAAGTPPGTGKGSSEDLGAGWKSGKSEMKLCFDKLRAGL